MTATDALARTSLSQEAPRIFLSYAPADTAFAKHLGEELVAHGAVVADAETFLAHGEAWDEAVIAAIRNADSLVVVVPEKEGQGKNALMELGMARSLNKRIFIVSPDHGRLHDNPFPISLSRRKALVAAPHATDTIVNTILSPR